MLLDLGVRAQDVWSLTWRRVKVVKDVEWKGSAEVTLIAQKTRERQALLTPPTVRLLQDWMEMNGGNWKSKEKIAYAKLKIPFDNECTNSTPR